jgi:hypothetical protein
LWADLAGRRTDLSIIIVRRIGRRKRRYLGENSGD